MFMDINAQKCNRVWKQRRISRSRQDEFFRANYAKRVASRLLTEMPRLKRLTLEAHIILTRDSMQATELAVDTIVASSTTLVKESHYTYYALSHASQ